MLEPAGFFESDASELTQGYWFILELFFIDGQSQQPVLKTLTGANLGNLMLFQDDFTFLSAVFL